MIDRGRMGPSSKHACTRQERRRQRISAATGSTSVLSATPSATKRSGLTIIWNNSALRPTSDGNGVQDLPGPKVAFRQVSTRERY